MINFSGFNFISCAIQGISESMPISSSFHLALFGIPHSLSAFLHFGTFFAFFLFSIPLIFELLINFRIQVIFKLTLMLAPTLVLGFFLKNYDFNFSIKTLAIFNLLAAVFMWFSSFQIQNNKLENINNKRALLIGIGACFAFLPGVSRMGATWSCLRFAKIKADLAFQITILLGIPLCLGASILHFSLENIWLALLSFPITYLLLFISKKLVHKWHFFALYRIIASLIILFK